MEEPKISKLRFRILACIIDYFLYFSIVYFYIDLFGVEKVDEAGNSAKSVSGLLAIPLIILWFLMFPILEGSIGQTIGKNLVGIKVISIEFKDGFGIIKAFKRRILDWLELNFFGILAIIVLKNSPNWQRIGDMMAGTMVVNVE